MGAKAGEISDCSSPDLNPSNFSLNSQIPGSSLSLSLLSEPPDLRNWFSSYIYESPSLDAEYERKFLASEEIESEKFDAFSEENDREEGKEHVEGSGDAGGGQIGSFNEDDKWEEVSEYKGNHCIEGDVLISKVDKHRSVEGKPLEDVMRPSKENITSCLNYEYPLEEPRGKVASGGDLFERNDCKINYLEDKDCREEINCLSSQRNVDSRRSDGTSLKTSMSRSTDVKEEGKESKENGFISVRKNKHSSENGGSSLNIISQKNHVTAEVHEKVGRRPLSERTNFQFEAAMPEIAGKWKCPQKSKPDFGPPLKQLRLERWVHRVE